MKKSELKMMIREVVREEIRLGLKEVIGVSKQPINAIGKEVPRKKQNYSKNPVLNEVLNETLADDWETLGGETFTSDRMGDLLGSSVEQPQQPNVDSRVREMGANPSSVPKEVKDNIFNKDYRELMKTIDKKQKQKNGV